MKVVILAGGLGSRISEESGVRPKPMIEIGGRPILWHIMKIYAAHGLSDFVVCLGYKGYMVKEYFANYFLHMADITFDLAENRMEVHQKASEPWRVTLVDTGDNSQTGGRLKRVERYVAGEPFCLTYGDGVADVDIGKLLAFHKKGGRLATVTAVRPPGRFGALAVDGDRVSGFVEKPAGDGGWINGGFFVLQPEVLGYLQGDGDVWEYGPMERLAREGQLGAFHHEGFWQPMDTLRDKNILEDLWAQGKAPWKAWSGRRVLVTGHTGFKGGWLSVWLASLGARVTGYALDPPTEPSFFESSRVADVLEDRRGDIRDALATRKAIAAADPEVVFHLAAQSIVKQGYREPVETYATNVVGTASVLDACRYVPGVRAIVVVTTDKCYQNREWDRGYVETDALGGHDPYSSSKACAELVSDSFRNSWFTGASPPVGLATARAGNVIGGGDWAADRLIPDVVRAAIAGNETMVRNPRATRPWQHVLEPVHGYLLLAQALLRDPAGFSEPWNFGPDQDGDQPVSRVLERLSQLWPGKVRWRTDGGDHPHEAGRLMLDSEKARERLSWRPKLALDDALRLTAQWYGRFIGGERNLRAETEAQIRHHSTLAQPR